MFPSKIKDALTAAGILVAGMAFWIWSWYMPLYEGVYHMGLAAVAPILTMTGIRLFFFADAPNSPYAKAWAEAKKESRKLPFNEWETKDKVLMTVGLVVGITNALFIDFYFGD